MLPLTNDWRYSGETVNGPLDTARLVVACSEEQTVVLVANTGGWRPLNTHEATEDNFK